MPCRESIEYNMIYVIKDNYKNSMYRSQRLNTENISYGFCCVFFCRGLVWFRATYWYVLIDTDCVHSTVCFFVIFKQP